MAWLQRPVIRRPVFFVSGILLAVTAGLLFQPHWVDLCTRINQRAFVNEIGQEVIRGGECAYVSPTAMAGNFLLGFGIFTMIIVPIIFSLAQLRHGYDWETSRVETAVSNLPILSGFIYIAAGMGLAYLGS